MFKEKPNVDKNLSPKNMKTILKETQNKVNKKILKVVKRLDSQLKQARMRLKFVQKNELVGEDCYRIENGEIVCYRALAKCISTFNMNVQSKKYEALPEVKDLDANTPVHRNGYSGWALHYMKFLQKRKYIGNIKYEKRDRELLHPNS